MNPLIDVDVHVRWESDEELLPYLPKTWHQRWLTARGGHSARGLLIQPKFFDPGEPYPSAHPYIPGLTTVNPAAAPDPATLSRDWLDRHGIEAAVASCHDAPLIATYADVDYPLEVARAVNRWLADKFLDADPRLHGSITVATQDPEEAAKEIRRAAAHSRMVQVLLPAGARMPYGHRYYRPIFEAAQECGLAIAIPAGTEGLGTSNPPTPSGWPSTAAEMCVARASTFIAHLTSLVTEGTFVTYPNLTVIGLEAGVAWLPPYLWRFDKNWKALRSECPWLREPPSEMVCRHFRFGTAGIVPVEPAAEFWRLMESVPGGAALPIYASNFPRWDMESPEESFVLRTAPAEALTSIRAGGARAAYPRLAISAVAA